MKKLIAVLVLLSFAAPAFATPPNLVPKRQAVAIAAVQAVNEYIDAYNKLLALKEERSKFVSDFQDSDFTSVSGFNAAGISHIDATMIGTLFDFVIPSITTNYTDSGNGGRNQQILQQVSRR